MVIERYGMKDKKIAFKAWLKDSGVKDRSISTYISCLNALTNNHWEELDLNVSADLAVYYEFSNKKYFLDRITIWQALDYFETILPLMEKITASFFEDKPIKLSIYDGKEDYCFEKIPFKLILKYLLLFNRVFFQSANSNTPLDNLDDMHLLLSLVDLESQLDIKDTRNLALHIDYNQKNVSTTKSALIQYQNFINSKNQSLQAKSDEILLYIQTTNPNNKIGENYKIKQELTGKTPLQIEIKDLNRSYDYDTKDFVLIKEDLAQILNIDRKTVNTHFCKKNKIRHLKTEKDACLEIEGTVLRDYFSISSVNTYLNKNHHFVDNNAAQLSKKSDGLLTEKDKINYDLKGYKHWVSRRFATEMLKISHNAFDSVITGKNCSYLSYSCSKYYKPDLEYLQKSFNIKRVQKRKEKYKHKIKQ